MLPIQFLVCRCCCSAISHHLLTQMPFLRATLGLQIKTHLPANLDWHPVWFFTLRLALLASASKQDELFYSSHVLFSELLRHGQVE